MAHTPYASVPAQENGPVVSVQRSLHRTWGPLFGVCSLAVVLGVGLILPAKRSGGQNFPSRLRAVEQKDQLPLAWAHYHDETQQQKEEAGCGQIVEGVVFWTRAGLNVKSHVTSAEVCQMLCQENLGCSVWTWVGEETTMSHVCFLKKLADGEQVAKEPKKAVVSGVICRSSQNPAGQNEAPDATQHGPSTKEMEAPTSQSTSAAPTSPTPPVQPNGKGCDLNEGMDVLGKKVVRKEEHVTNAEVCRATCRAAPGCDAWTWGKLSNTCSMKSAERGSTPRFTQRDGVVSGLACLGAAVVQMEPESTTGSKPPATHTTTTQATTATSKRAPVPQITVVVKANYGSLFCFSFVRPSAKDLALVSFQQQKRLSIFACDESIVYSNQSLDVKFEVSVVHFTSTPTTDADVYHTVWTDVVRTGRFKLHDWTVKVEPDCVFLPDRLRVLLRKNYGETSQKADKGLYLNNCINGLQGAVEVLSQKAVVALNSGWHHCKAHFKRLCSGDCGWGEDLFIDQCLSGVLKIKREYVMGLLIEEHCEPPVNWKACHAESVGFHAFGTMEAYSHCVKAAQSIDAKRTLQLE